MMQVLTIVSIAVEEKTPADKTEIHIVAHRGDGRPFRLRTDRGRPFWLLNFGGRSLETIKALFAEGAIISVDLKPVLSRWQTDADGYQRGDMSADPKTIKAEGAPRPELAAIRAQSVTATVPGEILYNAGDKMGARPVSSALYRGSG